MIIIDSLLLLLFMVSFSRRFRYSCRFPIAGCVVNFSTQECETEKIDVFYLMRTRLVSDPNPSEAYVSGECGWACAELLILFSGNFPIFLFDPEFLRIWIYTSKMSIAVMLLMHLVSYLIFIFTVLGWKLRKREKKIGQRKTETFNDLLVSFVRFV